MKSEKIRRLLNYPHEGYFVPTSEDIAFFESRGLIKGKYSVGMATFIVYSLTEKARKYIERLEAVSIEDG